MRMSCRFFKHYFYLVSLSKIENDDEFFFIRLFPIFQAVTCNFGISASFLLAQNDMCKQIISNYVCYINVAQSHSIDKYRMSGSKLMLSLLSWLIICYSKVVINVKCAIIFHLYPLVGNRRTVICIPMIFSNNIYA